MRGHPRALDDRTYTLEQRDPLLAQVQFDTGLHEQLQSIWSAGVDPEHLLPLARSASAAAMPERARPTIR